MGVGLKLLPATLHGKKKRIKIMVNCLIWKIAVLALILAAATRDSGASVIVSEVESESQGNGESPVPSTDKMDQFNRFSTRLASEVASKVTLSFFGVRLGALGLLDNFVEYLTQAGQQFTTDLQEYTPHIKEFYNALPAEAYHKLVLQILRTAHKQSKDHCGKIILKYNPFHPDLKATRSKRETEKMTLAKFGQALSSWMTSIDDGVAEWLTKTIPAYCPLVEEWLKDFIANVEKMKPEDVKKEWVRASFYLPIDGQNSS